MNGLKLAFKVKAAKSIRKNSNSLKRVSSKLIIGECVEIDGKLKVKVNINCVEGLTTNILDFTEDSYDLKGKIRVFSKTIDEYGRHDRYERDITKATTMYGSKDKYIPFIAGWLVNGYIYKQGLVYKYKHNETLNIKGYRDSY